jgi:proline-specific peptidase
MSNGSELATSSIWSSRQAAPEGRAGGGRCPSGVNVATIEFVTSQTSLTSRFVNRSGLRLSYRVQGAGPIMVCHPGGPGFSADYLQDIGGIDQVRTLVLLNPRGTAESSRPADPEAYDIDDYVNDVEDLRLHLGLESMDLLGQSHGGVVAIDYAARFPRRVKSLVLVTTLARFAAAQKDAMDAAMARRSGQPWYQEAMAAVEQEQAGKFKTDEELGALWAREVYLYFAKVGDTERAYIQSMRGEKVNADALRFFNREVFEKFDLRDELPRIKARTLVVVGEDDFIAGPVAGAEIVAGIPSADLVTIKDAGHFVFVEQRQAFRDAVLRWLESS